MSDRRAGYGRRVLFSGVAVCRDQFAHLRRSRAMRRFFRNKWAIASVIYILFLVVLALFPAFFAPRDPNAQDLAHRLSGPSTAHLLGTDLLGRDTLSRLIYAVGVTLNAAVLALGISFVAGVPIGLAAGYLGGWIDAALSRLFDAFISIPPLILALAIVGALGPGLTNAMIAVGITVAPRFFRISRAAADSVRHETYIEACRSIGVSTPRILYRHVIPNASGPLLVQASFAIGLAIISEAGLSFLGLGVQLPSASLGSMVLLASQQLNRDLFQLVPPSVAVTLTIWAFFVLGDAVRDALGRSSGGE